MKKTFLILGLLLCSVTCFAQKWQLVYQNNAQGETVSGSITELISAVRDGLSIRVGWKSQSVTDPKRKVEHIAEAKFLTIMSDATVFAQIDPIVGQTPDFANQLITLKEGTSWVMIAASNGKSDAMMTDTKTGEVLGQNQRLRAIDWYVLKQ